MELQREVWVEYMDLGVISIYMVMDTMALGEVDWGGTESKTRLRSRTETQSETGQGVT